MVKHILYFLDLKMLYLLKTVTAFRKLQNCVTEIILHSECRVLNHITLTLIKLTFGKEIIRKGGGWKYSKI
jgi:hypothetical protein